MGVEQDKTVENISVSGIFSQSSIVFIFWFLAIYFIIYFVLGIFFNRNASDANSPLRIARILDAIIFLFIILFIISSLSNLKYEDIKPNIIKKLHEFEDFGENPYSIFTIIIFIIVFYAIIYLIRLPMDSLSKPVSVMLIETIAILLFVVILISDFFKYMLKVDLLSLIIEGIIEFINYVSIEPTSKPTPKPTATEKPVLEGDEVFNIRNNLYTYDEAKSVCSIYGAKLANYDQLEKSYNDGGEWCNYGWSDGQMALFPTQKDTWNNLQKSDKTKNACGRPGINGGYIKNKNMRFGVNCYGKKPKPSDKEKSLMNANIEDKIPESDSDKALRKKIEIWKNNSDKILLLKSFNKKDWTDCS